MLIVCMRKVVDTRENNSQHNANVNLPEYKMENFISQENQDPKKYSKTAMVKSLDSICDRGFNTNISDNFFKVVSGYSKF